jgi:hypothetical protein
LLFIITFFNGRVGVKVSVNVRINVSDSARVSAIVRVSVRVIIALFIISRFYRHLTFYGSSITVGFICHYKFAPIRGLIPYQVFLTTLGTVCSRTDNPARNKKNK